MELEASMDLIDRDKIRNYGHHVHHQVAMFFFSKCQLAYLCMILSRLINLHTNCSFKFCYYLVYMIR